MEQTKQPVQTGGESLFEEMAISESEEAFAGHSCLCWSTANATSTTATAPGAS
ncbi:azolemycin family RiPP peptide [Streptomyces sp. G44]|uniref:azolemycin family RiPP peptide n=1 Tax=Streptomyces sp. G44 TaxID=2807632 RepID=UPI00196220B1|nr:azolemycin family RiPP peptide [Streptomyces sp. G44]MBM7171852.1 azolemycin family RiPP peptide [Streptomyces sp. G44]